MAHITQWVRLSCNSCGIHKRSLLLTSQGMHYALLNQTVPQTNVSGTQSQRYSTATSYYDTLGISPKATQAQVKAAYYNLSKLNHPDISKAQGAKEKFAVISEAYEVLGNVKNRRQYDRGMLHPSHDPDVDMDLESKIRRAKFSKRTGKPHTGRSHAYNFDEYYREHYGESIRMTYKAHEANSRMQEERKKRYKQDMTLAWSLGTALMAAVVWVYKKHH